MTGKTINETAHLSVEALKAQAKRLRQALAEDGDFISHSEALELLARQMGFRDWNALHAAAQCGPRPLQVGARVSGRYLGQKFSGIVIGVETLSGERRRVTVDFDEAVDVVTFDSFSAFRKRVTAVIGENNESAEKTSNGRPQMEIEQ